MVTITLLPKNNLADGGPVKSDENLCLLDCTLDECLL